MLPFILFYFLSILVKQEVLKQSGGLSGNDCDICCQAIQIFTSVCTSINDGTITVSLLYKLCHKRDEIRALVTAITVPPETHIDDTNPLIVLTSISIETIESSLALRMKELNTYNNQLSCLAAFSHHLNELSITGKYMHAHFTYL